MSISQAIQAIQQTMEENGIRAETGLGDEMFLFASTLMPIINVDLLVTDSQNNVLLSWRDDAHCGRGWHIPGGCIRFRETMAERIEKTALRELGCKVRFDPEVLHVFEIIIDQQRNIKTQQERAHSITLVIACQAEENFSVENQTKKMGEPGYLQWFPTLPDDLLEVQKCYHEQWTYIQSKLKGRYNYGHLEK